MNTNKNVWIFVIWLSLTVLHVEMLSAQNSWNWFEAQQLCKENNDSLPQYYISSSRIRQHWTSRYRRYSFWIKILGCYNDTSPNDAQNFQMDIPSAGFCQEICATMNSSIFGIKKECKCFGKLFLERPVSPVNCDTIPQTTGGIRFTELGSINAYTLYESDFNVTKRDEIYCVAVQCHPHKRFYFKLFINCSVPYRAVCQNSVSESYQNWTSSMEICKKETSSYLAGNVSLNDINQTCDRLNVTLTGPAWLGVAKEVYTGYDRGVPVNTEERKSFLECVKCDEYDCWYFTECTERLDIVYCEKGFSTITSDPVTNNPGTTHSITYTSEASKHAPETSTNFNMSISTKSSVHYTSKQDVTNSSNTLTIILPVVMTAVLIGCFATAAVFYIRRKRGLRNQNNKQLDLNDTGNSYANIDVDVNNANYVVLQPQSETNYDRLHVGLSDESNPYRNTADGIYDQVRDR